MQDFSCRVRFGIENGYQIRAVLGRGVNLTVGIHTWIAPVRRHLIVEISGRAAPVPQRDHKVALHSLRPFGLRKRQLAACNTVSPIGEIFERDFGVEPRDIASHEGPRASRLKPAPPRFHGIRKCAEFFRNRAHALRAEGMTRLAGACLDDIEPFTLALYLLQREFAFLGHPKQREPIERGIVFGRLRGGRGGNGLQV